MATDLMGNSYSFCGCCTDASRWRRRSNEGSSRVVVTPLLDAGVDTNYMNEYGETAVDIAGQKGLERMVKLLAEAALEDLG